MCVPPTSCPDAGRCGCLKPSARSQGGGAERGGGDAAGAGAGGGGRTRTDAAKRLRSSTLQLGPQSAEAARPRPHAGIIEASAAAAAEYVKAEVTAAAWTPRRRHFLHPRGLTAESLSDGSPPPTPPPTGWRRCALPAGAERVGPSLLGDDYGACQGLKSSFLRGGAWLEWAELFVGSEPAVAPRGER